jgi:hypothetical protein
MPNIENAKIEDYFVRPYEPGKGGSGDSAKRLHIHSIVIDGAKFSFFAIGHEQWIHKSDTVSFDFEVKGSFNNVQRDTVVVKDKDGQIISRGDHRFKNNLRVGTRRSEAKMDAVLRQNGHFLP